MASACVPIEPAPSTASESRPSCDISKVSIDSHFTIPSEFEFDGHRVGGISGADYSRELDQWVFVTDDRGPHGGTRFLTATLGLAAPTANRLKFESAIRGAIAGEGSGIDIGYDAESVRFGMDGRGLIWTFEGNRDEAVKEGLAQLRLGSRDSERITLPSELVKPDNGTSGPRPNRSFEGLSIDRETGLIWLGLEAPRYQDGGLPTGNTRSMVPIFGLGADGAVAKTLRYPVEPLNAPLPGKLADNGLSELLHVEGESFLVLERAGSQQHGGDFAFRSRLFCAHPASGEDALAKHIIFDTSDHSQFRHANFEAIAFGPDLEDGSRSIFMVSDNNFASDKPTHFLILKVR